jgi:hypothetical protein
MPRSQRRGSLATTSTFGGGQSDTVRIDLEPGGWALVLHTTANRAMVGPLTAGQSNFRTPPALRWEGPLSAATTGAVASPGEPSAVVHGPTRFST